MRYAGVIFLLIILIPVLYWFIFIWATNKPQKRPITNEEDRTTANEIARQLDRVLTDPTLIGSSGWRNEASRLVDKWYKGR